MRQTSKSLKTLVFAMALASVASLSLTTVAMADSEAGFIMVGGGESASGGVGSAGETESGGYHWGESESGGPMDTGAESDSGGALQSEASSQSGGAYSAGSSSSAVWGGNDNSMGRYVQYYGP
jgi:hypothetical protein